MIIKSLYLILFIALLPVSCFANKAADSLVKKAEHAFKQGEYAMVLEYALQALELVENGTCEERANGHVKVARAYYHLQQRDVALQYFRRTISISKECGNDSFLRICYRQMGAIYVEQAKHDSAKVVLSEAERMLLQTTQYGEIASLYAIMGELYRKEPRGKSYFDLAERYALKSGDTVIIAFTNIKQGIYATFNKDCSKGEMYFSKALELYRKVHLVEGEMYAMKSLAWAMSDCGKAKESYQLMSNVQFIKDSIFKKETAEKTARYRTLYETEKKERENAVLAKQNAVKELQLAKQAKDRRMILGGFSIAILVLIVAFLFIYTRYKLKKQRQMAEQQELSFAAVINAEEKERKRIAVDLHDGVGQTMSAARINLSVLQHEMQFTSEEQKLTFEKIVALVDESCREVRSVSHSMMPNALLKSGLASAIRNFINQIDNRVLSVDFYSEGLDTSLHANNEIVLYRVIQECVNNVIKHSGASKLFISLIKDEEGISVTIEDNGRGFDAGMAESSEGIGLKNIQSRIGYLKGTVEWDSSPGRGTAVIINIPV